ncbi:MAG: amino acid adenylation domain-containing protein, partial [Myxococcaceae bacterium]|nr:amino acid adenylation domain-containing protein [Myxococcaceae bacterium]
MKDIRQQLEKLTPKQRALYELMLKEKARPRQTLARRQGSGPAPASFPQQRLWVLQQLEPECSFAYNVHITVRFFGPLDVGVLERSFNEVVRRHESLRTTLGSEQGAPVLVVHPEVRVPLPVMELGAWPQARQLAEVERRTREESLRPFELERAPLMRGTVLRLAADDHVVLVTMHHLVTDRWSLGVLVRELMALYEAFSLGRPSPLPELPLQYSDYAAWQREQMKGEHLRKELDYWKRQLTPLPPPLELPTDRPRPARKSYRGSREFVRLPPSLTRALKAVAQQQDCTLFMLLLAAFKSVLHRYCGQADISVGSPIANRRLPELELLIGFFVNTLVLRTDLSEDPTFRALLQRVRTTCLQAYSHQDLPFERLVEELHPERHLNRNPLFQVMFSFQNTPRQDLAVQGLSTQYLLVDPGSAKFDLLLELREEVEDEITGWLEYDTDLFDGSTLARLHGHLMRVLERVAVTQEDRLSALPLLTEAERHQLLVEWSGPRRDYPLEETLHARVEAQVERSPHAVAVSFEGHSLTYRELNAQANRLAWHLSALGVGPESRVAVCLERSTHLVVALLATLKAGAAYVPLDPSYPPQRLEWMLEDAKPQVLLAQESLLGRLPGQALPTVLLDTSWDSGRQLSEDNPPPLASPDNLAYVLFTSGSTGRPKGAMNTHRAISNRLLWMQEAYGLGPREAVLQKTPFSFDVSVWEFFWPLRVGARLVVARPGGHQDPAYLASLIHEQHVTTLHFVPPMLQAFLQEPELERACASVRRIICSGEALPAELARRCLQRLPQAELHNLYGPTEAAVDVTAWACRREDERPSVPIGRPIANTYVRLMDGQGGLVPVGVPGELYIGGVQVGRGYLGRPELTAERFVSDPYSPRPQERLYRTGDLARWLPDGSIDFLGRVDFQVKVRGLRIELGEVESALLQAPGVREAVVVAREELAGDKRLVGYVVPQPGQSLDAAVVRALLQQRLPEYMVPS